MMVFILAQKMAFLLKHIYSSIPSPASSMKIAGIPNIKDRLRIL